MCRPDGRHVLNNQGTDDYVLTKNRQEFESELNTMEMNYKDLLKKE